MINPRRLQANRNLKVLLGRFTAEHPRPGHVYKAVISHDIGCPCMAAQSLLLCECKPEITIREVGNARSH